jgi:seryl-tRNA synthetase
MLDLKRVEEKPEILRKVLKERGMTETIKQFNDFLKLRKDWKNNKKKLDELRHKRNVISLEINEAVKLKQDISKKKQEAKKTAQDISKIEDKTKEMEDKMYEMALHFPNLISEGLPKKEKIMASSGKANKKAWQKDYIELNKKLKLIEFDQAIEMAGEGFYSLKADFAILQRALINFCLDMAKKKGYKEITLPILINRNAVINSGHLPKFEEGMYKTKEGFYLSPTEEVGLLNLYAGKILNEKDFPINICSFMPSFRTEKGATKGMMRSHQFDEVELFKIVEPKELKTSSKELQKMIKDATSILKALKLPYRVKLLPAWDLSMQNSITYDIEVFSSKSGWLEVSSCSNCLDFQARRARIFFMKKGKKELVHTLNGTGLGLNRVFIAIIENYQQKNGTIKVPTVLQKYCGFKEIKLIKKIKKVKKKKTINNKKKIKKKK